MVLDHLVSLVAGSQEKHPQELFVTRWLWYLCTGFPIGALLKLCLELAFLLPCFFLRRERRG